MGFGFGAGAPPSQSRVSIHREWALFCWLKSKGGMTHAAGWKRKTDYPGRGLPLCGGRRGGAGRRGHQGGGGPVRAEGQIPRRRVCGRPGRCHHARPHQRPHPHLFGPGPGPVHRRVQPHQLSGGAGRPVVVHRPASDPGRHPGLRLRHGAGLHPGRRDHHLRPPRLLLRNPRLPFRHQGRVSGAGHPGQPLL